MNDIGKQSQQLSSQHLNRTAKVSAVPLIIYTNQSKLDHFIAKRKPCARIKNEIKLHHQINHSYL